MPTLYFLNSTNFNVLIIGIALGSIALLGFTVYFNNKKSITNRAFLFYCLMVIFWGISNFFEYQFKTAESVLWASRVHLFISVWYSLAFFRLSYVFLNDQVSFPKWYRYFIVPLVITTSLITLTPFVFVKVVGLALVGQVTILETGPGMIVFGFIAFGLLIAGLIILARRAVLSKSIEKKQLWSIFVGMFLTACLTLTFNLILPVVFKDVTYIPFASLFVLPFICLIFYAIYKHKLFNLKIVAVAFVSFILTIFSILNVIYATDLSQIMLNASFFILILLGSIILIRSILKEVEQREKIEQLATQRESFIHFLSHEVKGILGKNKDMFELLLDKNSGATPEQVDWFLKRSSIDTRSAVDMVENLLRSDDFKNGKIPMDMKIFDMKSAVLEAIDDLKLDIEAKGLILKTAIDETEQYNVLGDHENITKHVIRNLIDNAIRYTPKGEVELSLSKKNDKVLLSVKDSGVGITSEDMSKLFTEGGNGKNSIKVNIHSTGYGLFFAKGIVEAHHGKIWAESEGEGKGTTFFVELDLKE